MIRDDARTQTMYNGIRGALSFITHDIGNMATSASGAFELIVGRLPESIRKDLKASIAMVTRNLDTVAGFITSQLIDYTTGQLALHRHQTDLVAIIKGAYNIVCFDRDLSEKAGAMVVNYAVPESAPILADEPKLMQVLVNLFSNAVKYAEGITIDCKVEEHTGKKGFYRFAIGNQAAISAADAKHLVREAYRGANAKETKGHGFGLANANNIVCLHGGRLEIKTYEDRRYFEVVGELPKR